MSPKLISSFGTYFVPDARLTFPLFSRSIPVPTYPSDPRIYHLQPFQPTSHPQIDLHFSRSLPQASPSPSSLEPPERIPISTLLPFEPTLPSIPTVDYSTLRSRSSTLGREGTSASGESRVSLFRRTDAYAFPAFLRPSGSRPSPFFSADFQDGRRIRMGTTETTG